MLTPHHVASDLVTSCPHYSSACAVVRASRQLQERHFCQRKKYPLLKHRFLLINHYGEPSPTRVFHRKGRFFSISIRKWDIKTIRFSFRDESGERSIQENLKPSLTVFFHEFADDRAGVEGLQYEVEKHAGRYLSSMQ
ncbi:hypothetical protein EVAR_100593_1 [Eumeta japonica]|uniref:Uncharacterized protein n=1 Tax=Eumeta variegata TaxID=151549 RepID=A0A4C2A217_EUMVA|nr:hypothetical protein EVAR_100593_1 [Eumeta japonica]